MNVFKRYQDEDHNGEDGHYYISISDLMTSLLFIFILILSYVMLSFVKKQDELNNEIKKIEQNLEFRAELLRNLQDDLFSKNINVEIDQDNGNMRLKSDVLFGSGSADISEEGRRQISEIAKLLIQKMSEPKYADAIDTIFIEGHTDTVRIRVSNSCRDQWTNKELSAQRAINTYMQMSDATEGAISHLKNIKKKHLLSYSGYADTRLLCDESDPEIEKNEELLTACKAKNRRIEFYFTVNTPDTEKIRERLDE